jgi:hypothetical protein
LTREGEGVIEPERKEGLTKCCTCSRLMNRLIDDMQKRLHATGLHIGLG